MKHNTLINTPIVIWKCFKSSKYIRNKILIIVMHALVVDVVYGSEIIFNVKYFCWSSAVAPQGGL